MSDLMETGISVLSRERRLEQKLDEVLKDRIPHEALASQGYKALVSLMTFAFYEGVKFQAQEEMTGRQEAFTLTTATDRNYQ